MSNVFEALAVAIKELDIPLDALITKTLGAFDAASLWDIDAATSLSRSAGRLSILPGACTSSRCAPPPTPRAG